MDPLASAVSQVPNDSFSQGIWDWSGRGTSHVDFSKDEALPLQQGRFLGYGVHGGVYETTCKGRALAWKKKYCRTEIGPRERKEIEILKKLNHRHIVKLVGTYTHGPFLGLLLWPVAACDLATFLEDVDKLGVTVRNPRDAITADHAAILQRLSALGFNSLASYRTILCATTLRLAQSLDCLASAIACLHHQRIRHKDLKPSNILLSSNGLWVTDFGNSTDFSTLTESATQGWERGTPKYFAPEVADYKPNGRSADIFSLGCVFLEIIAILTNGYSLDDLMALRPEKNRSYEANLPKIIRWFDNFAGVDIRQQHLMGEVRMMLNLDPQARPSAADVETHLRLIDGLGDFDPITELVHSAPIPWVPKAGDGAVGQWMGRETPAEMFTIYIGNTHRYGDPKPGTDERHFWTFWVRPSRHEIVEKVHMFFHPSCSRPQRVFTEPPYEFDHSGWGYYTISVQVVLKAGYSWVSSKASRVPNGGQELGMLPLHWKLDFDRPFSQNVHHLGVCREDVRRPLRDGQCNCAINES